MYTAMRAIELRVHLSVMPRFITMFMYTYTCTCIHAHGVHAHGVNVHAHVC